MISEDFVQTIFHGTGHRTGRNTQLLPYKKRRIRPKFLDAPFYFPVLFSIYLHGKYNMLNFNNLTIFYFSHSIFPKLFYFSFFRENRIYWFRIYLVQRPFPDLPMTAW